MGRGEVGRAHRRYLLTADAPSTTPRTQTCTGNSLSPPKIGHLNSKLFLNEVAKKEKQLRKMLEGEGGVFNGRERALWAGVYARAFPLSGSMAWLGGPSFMSWLCHF